MASLQKNPYKKYKGILKGRRLTGSEAHDMMKRKAIKTTGSFHGKSNKLGYGGRAAQLKAQGVPGGVIGNLARRAHAAPGQANYHGGKRKKAAPASIGPLSKPIMDMVKPKVNPLKPQRTSPNSPANYGKAMQSAYAATKTFHKGSKRKKSSRSMRCKSTKPATERPQNKYFLKKKKAQKSA